MESNIFDSIVLEPAVDPEANAVLIPFMMVGPIIPFTDSDDVKGCGLNQ